MIARPALRTVNNAVARRGFQTTRARFGGHQTHPDQFFHYPEGPRSNIPFDPLAKTFAIKFWGFWITAFMTPVASSYWMTVKEQ